MPTPSFNDYGPITWWNRMPVYVTTILTAMFAAGLVVTGPVVSLGLFAFSGAAVLQGRVWQILTYAFVDEISLFALIILWCFYRWAIEVEKYIGRRRFLILFVLLILVQPVVCLIMWKVNIHLILSGNSIIVFAFLICFAALYPNIDYFFGLMPLKWFALASFAIVSFMQISSKNWVVLSLVWIECGVAFGYIRWIQHGGSFELPPGFFRNLFRRKPKFRVVPRPGDKKPPRVIEEDPVESIDPLLDKIAKQGLKSLTARERERLERVSENLAKKHPEA